MEGTFLFISIAVIVVTIAYLRHRERMEMLNKGVKPVSFSVPPAPRLGSFALLLGLFGVGIGLSLFIAGSIFQDGDSDMMTAATIVFASGLSLIAYWLFTKKDRDQARQLYEENMKALLAQHHKAADSPAPAETDTFNPEN